MILKKHTQMIFLCVFILLISVFTISFANSAAPTSIPDENAVFFEKLDGIELKHESIELSMNDQLDKGSFHVTYVLRNHNANDVSYKMWMVEDPSENFSEFEILVDKTPKIAVQDEIAYEKISNWKPRKTMEFKHPLEKSNEKIEGYSLFESSDMIPIFEWRLDIPANESVQVEFFYEASSGYMRSYDEVNIVYLQNYLLSPAFFFDGDPIVYFKINIPENTAISTNAESIKKVDSTTYSGMFELRSQETIDIALLDTENLIFNTNNIMMHNSLSILLFVVFLMLAYRFKRRWLALLFIGSGIFIVSHFKITYGMMFTAIMTSPVLLLLIIFFIFTWLKRKKSKLESE